MEILRASDWQLRTLQDIGFIGDGRSVSHPNLSCEDCAGQKCTFRSILWSSPKWRARIPIPGCQQCIYPRQCSLSTNQSGKYLFRCERTEGHDNVTIWHLRRLLQSDYLGDLSKPIDLGSLGSILEIPTLVWEAKSLITSSIRSIIFRHDRGSTTAQLSTTSISQSELPHPSIDDLSSRLGAPKDSIDRFSASSPPLSTPGKSPAPHHNKRARSEVSDINQVQKRLKTQSSPSTLCVGHRPPLRDGGKRTSIPSYSLMPSRPTLAPICFTGYPPPAPGIGVDADPYVVVKHMIVSLELIASRPLSLLEGAERTQAYLARLAGWVRWLSPLVNEVIADENSVVIRKDQLESEKAAFERRIAEAEEKLLREKSVLERSLANVQRMKIQSDATHLKAKEDLHRQLVEVRERAVKERGDLRNDLVAAQAKVEKEKEELRLAMIAERDNLERAKEDLERERMKVEEAKRDLNEFRNQMEDERKKVTKDKEELERKNLEVSSQSTCMIRQIRALQAEKNCLRTDRDLWKDQVQYWRDLRQSGGRNGSRYIGRIGDEMEDIEL